MSGRIILTTGVQIRKDNDHDEVLGKNDQWESGSGSLKGVLNAARSVSHLGSDQNSHFPRSGALFYGLGARQIGVLKNWHKQQNRGAHSTLQVCQLRNPFNQMNFIWWVFTRSIHNGK